MKLFYARILNGKFSSGSFMAKKNENGYVVGDSGFYFKNIPPIPSTGAVVLDKNSAVGKTELLAVNALIDYFNEQILDYEAFLAKIQSMRALAVARAKVLMAEENSV